MNFVECQGYMIPGLYYANNYCIWLLNWDKSPTQNGHLIEIWLFSPDGKRTCYIDPLEDEDFFNRYHSFDNLVGASIKIQHNKKNISIEAAALNGDVIQGEIILGTSILYSLINLTLSEKNKIVGKTETGKTSQNIPKKLHKITSSKITINGSDMGSLVSPKQEIKVGDFSISKRPILSHCKLRLEE